MRLASAPMEVVLLCDKHGNANVVKPDIGSAGPGCTDHAGADRALAGADAGDHGVRSARVRRGVHIMGWALHSMRLSRIRYQ